MNKIKIRKATDLDFEELVNVYNQARISIECFIDPVVSLDKFKSLVEAEEIHIATINDTVAGFVSVWTADNFIHHLYVTPKYQKQGIATTLLKTCIACYGLPLSLKSVITNTKAGLFYLSNNFIAESAHEGPDGPYRNYWLRQASLGLTV